MHSRRLRRDLQVHCRAGQCPAPEAPGVLPVLRRSVHLGRIRLLRRGPGGVTPITDTLSPRVLLRCSGCGLRWTAATLDPAACPACGRRERIALVRRFGPGRMSLQAGLSPARVIAPVRPVTWQPAPDRRIPDVRDVTTAAPPGNAIGRPHTLRRDSGTMHEGQQPRHSAPLAPGRIP
jgi:hypothetical protein